MAVQQRPRATWRIETYTGRKYLGQRFFFRARAANGEIIFPSEPYRDRDARDATVELIAKPSGAKIVELP